jgi:LacI family transcriptional regulator
VPRPKKELAGRNKPPGIREIAASLGISIGTVDRALHDRPGSGGDAPADPERAKACWLSTQPRGALPLRRSSSRIGVNLPEIASFFDLVRDGIQEAVRSVETSDVRVIHRSYPGLGDGEEEALAEALADNLHGLIMVPGQPVTLAPLLTKAAERGLPVVCVNTDAPEVEHLVTSASTRSPPARSWGAHGPVRRGKGPRDGGHGALNTIDHAQKVAGFRQALSEMWPDLRIAAVVEAHDHEPEAYEKSRQVLTETPDIAEST